MNSFHDINSPNSPQSSYTLAGLFMYSDLIILLLQFLQQKYAIQLSIHSIFGAPETIWNGGRLALSNYTDTNYTEELKKLADNGLVPCFTFTNHLIRKEHLCDRTGNALLSLAENCFTGYYVRTSSAFLEEYIRRHYAKAILLPSVIQVDMHGAQGNRSFYSKMIKRYGECVLHPFDNWNDDLIDGLNGTIEIIANEHCLPVCKNRMKHYNAIGIQQLAREGLTNIAQKKPRCPVGNSSTQCLSPHPNCSLPLNRVKQLEDKGVNRIKIQGRRDNVYAFFFDVLRYSLRDEFLVAQLYIPFCDVITSWLSHKQANVRNVVSAGTFSASR